MINAHILAAFILAGAFTCAGERTPEPRTFFKEQIGLSDEQIAAIGRGKAVAKVLPSGIPAEVFIFGAVHVNAAPEEYIRLAFDMERLRRLPGYSHAGRFSDPPRLSDLDGFALDPGDIQSLRSCRPGRCGVQLPAEMMQLLQQTVDWSAPDVYTQVNERMRRMALDILRRYRQSGNSVLGSYSDKENPFDVNGQLRSLLHRVEALPVYLPGLSRYLLDYPEAVPERVESLFYWERVHFGLKPTLRLNHALAYRSAGPRGTAEVTVVAVKQLYASHYFQMALDLTVCVKEYGGAGFYLISLRGSTQQGFSGFGGSLLRRIVASRTRSAQEKALTLTKLTLEARPFNLR